MKVIGIETSCDETAVAILEINPPSRKALKGTVRVLSNTISSQVKLHAKYGGVVPNLAAREHVKNIRHVFKLALKTAKIKDFKKEIDLIAVTRGPGLGPALLVGITFAKTIAWKYQKPLAGVSHLEGHIASNFLKKVGAISNFQFPISKQILNSKTQKLEPKTFPILNLIVSGGHTELVLMRNYGEYELIGETLDDAIGEAFDKVARLLGLGYPGGPLISKLAESGDSSRYPLPSPMIHSKDYNFSYSGLKTAVLYLTRDIGKLTPQIKKDISASFQKAAIDVLIHKTMKAAKEFNVKTIMLSGGVSANKALRQELEKIAHDASLKYSQPELEYTGDNAAMITLAGYMNWKKNPTLYASENTNWESVEMDANLGF